MKQRIIFVMNRWDSSKGGIQTVNRELLLALARLRPDLDCTAVVTFAEQAEVDQAFRNGVRLIHGHRVDDWLPVMMSEALKQIEPASVLAVVGHSSFSGDFALQLRNYSFPNARAVQFIHMDPMRTEGVKETKTDSFVDARETKQKIELEIAKRADLVFCVGPRLFRVTRDTFLAHQLDHNRVHRIDCGLTADQQVRVAAPEQPTVLCLGRTESIGAKGLDIFAYTAGKIDHQWSTNPLTKDRLIKPRYIVRGAENHPEALQAKLIAMAAEAEGNPEIIVRPYTTDKESLNADLRGATAFLMPSREEGFGLVACEAMSFGAPILVSQQSGIAELILETAAKTGQNFSRCTIDMSGDAHAIAARFADSTLPLLVEGAADELFYPRLRGHLVSVCSWEKGANTFIDVVEAAYQAQTAASIIATTNLVVTGDEGTPAKPPRIENVLAAQRESLMTKPGVIAVGLKQAIVVTVEKGAKPNIPANIDGFEVIVREVEEVKLTSIEPSSGHEILVNGVRRATVGLFGIDLSGQLFAVTVAHAFLDSFHDKIEMVVDGRRVLLTLEMFEEKFDWAILRVGEDDLPYSRRELGRRRPGAKAIIELPGRATHGTIDSVDMTVDLATPGVDGAFSSRAKRRYQDVFEIALETGFLPGGSGALVSDAEGNILGVVIGAMTKTGGSMSVLATSAETVLERHRLKPVTIDEIDDQPQIGLLLDSDEIASALFARLQRLRRVTRSSRIYFRGTTESGARFVCTIMRDRGNTDFAVAMTAMLIDNKPDAVFIVGRCVGLQPDQQLGDVVIASEVLVYEPTFLPDALHYTRPRVAVTASLLHTLGHDLAMSDRLGRVHFGPIASANSVIPEDLSSEPSFHVVEALEMGSAGAIQAANAISGDLPVVIISVISDLMQVSKLDNPRVVHRAAEVVLEMVSHLKITAPAKRRSLTIDRTLQLIP